jgi:hypothetical protein
MKLALCLLSFCLCLAANGAPHFPSGTFSTSGYETAEDGTAMPFAARHELTANHFVSTYRLKAVVMTLEVDAKFDDKIGFFSFTGIRRLSDPSTGHEISAVKLKGDGYCGNFTCSYDFKSEDGTAGRETILVNGKQMYRTGAFLYQGHGRAIWEERTAR